MAKFTRRSYRRRKMFLGICLFASMALISTGFASWIISLNAKGEIGGDVNIGIVTDSSVTIEIDREYVENDPKKGEIKPKFVFGSAASDISGRIRNNGKPEDYENFSVTVSGTIKNTQFVTNTTIELEVSAGVLAAAQAGYIVLPECVAGYNTKGEVEQDEAGQPVKTKLMDIDTSKSSQDFSYEISFAWGEKFGGMNPGVYYDSHEEGKAKTGDEMKAELAAFRKMILELPEETSTEEALSTVKALEFNVIIEAICS